MRDNDEHNFTAGRSGRAGRNDYRRRRAYNAAVFFSLTAFVMVAVALIGSYLVEVEESRVAEQRALVDRVETLARNQSLLSDFISNETTLTGETSTSTDAPAREDESPVPFTISDAEDSLGIIASLYCFKVTGPRTESGWPVEMCSGNYLDGQTGLAVASQRGDPFNGAYYVDNQNIYREGHLLKNAKVNVYGWKKDEPFSAHLITGGKLGEVIKNEKPNERYWRWVWFWVKETRTHDILEAWQVEPPG